MTARRFKTVVVTGAAGFVGRHLLRHLREAENGPDRIVAWDLREPDERGAAPEAEWRRVDLADAGQVARALDEDGPDAVLHLAGVARADDLQTYFRANVAGCRNLLAAAADWSEPPRVLVVGTAAQYGITSGDNEVVEESRPLLARTPYGVTKIMQEQWALLVHEAGDVPVVAVRPFNIMGPGQPPSLVPAAFLHQVLDVLDGRQEAVRVGNVETCRDFTDVRDAAAALWLLVSADEAVLGTVYNVASGEAIRIREMLEASLDLAGQEIPVRTDPSRFKTVDVPSIVGDAGRLAAATGWRPTIPWRQSLADTWAALRATTALPERLEGE